MTLTRTELIRRVMDAEAVEVQAICPTPNCGLSPVRVDDFYRPKPGETDSFDPISGVCQGCGARVYFMNSIPWSRVILPIDPTPPPTAGGKDDEPDVPE